MNLTGKRRFSGLFFAYRFYKNESKMKKILIALMTVASIACRAQTYYCPISSVDGVAKKADQWFNVQEDAVNIKISSGGKTDSLHYKKIASTNPAVIYFKEDEITSSLTIVHSSGSMKGTKYTDVLSFKKNLLTEESVGLWYCTRVENHP